MNNFIAKPFIPCPTVGNSWTINNMLHSSSDDYKGAEYIGNQHHVHYIRRSTKRVVRYLTTQYTNYVNYMARFNTALTSGSLANFLERIPSAVVNGASGVGKSTEVFGWMQCADGDKFYIHAKCSSTRDYFSCVYFCQSQNIYWKQSFMKFDAIMEFLNNDANSMNILVLDGSFAQAVLTLLASQAAERRLFVVICASGRSQLHRDSTSNLYNNGFDPDNETMEINSLIVDGFTLEEYAEASAIIIQPFQDGEEALRAERFYYAGGNARLYYGEVDTVFRIAAQIDSKIAIIKKLEDFFSEASSDVVNTLQTYVDGQVTIVSEYVTKKLAFKAAAASVVSRALNILIDNPSWQGWVAKLDLLHRIRTCHTKSLTWEAKGAQRREWKIQFSNIIEYGVLNSLDGYQPRFDDILQQRGQEPSVLCFIPTTWNNGGFDSIIIFFTFERRNRRTVITPHIRIIQCTIAASHSKQLGSVADFLEHIFPLTPEDTYLHDFQQQFAKPVVEYSILTRRHRFDQHEVQVGTVTGLPRIRRWHAQFSIERNAHKYYFDGDYSYRISSSTQIPL